MTVGASSKKGKVLVVDDSEEICEAVSMLLETTWRFEAVIAGDGREALSVLARQEIDVILMDERMPNMSGHECFAQLREQSINIPVIFFTGLMDPKRMNTDLALGAFDYISKPFAPDDLLILIEDAFNAQQRMKNIKLQKWSLRHDAAAVFGKTRIEREILHLEIGGPVEFQFFRLALAEQPIVVISIGPGLRSSGVADGVGCSQVFLNLGLRGRVFPHPGDVRGEVFTARDTGGLSQTEHGRSAKHVTALDIPHELGPFVKKSRSVAF
jgi:CheY-like chemotaxis protein